LLYFSACISPAYFLLALYVSIEEILQATGVRTKGAYGTVLAAELATEAYYQDMAMWIFIGVFGLFILLHVFDLKRKVIRWVFDIGTVFCVLIVNLLVAALILQPFQTGATPIWCIFIASALIPFLLALLQSGESFSIMLKCSIPFLWWTPCYVIFVTYYGLCRLWELTWGNRPSSLLPSAHSNITGQGSNSNTEQLSKLQREKVKLDLIDDSRLVCILLLILNVCIVLVMKSYQDNIYVVACLLAFAIGGLWIHYLLAVFYVAHNWWVYFGKPRSQPQTLPVH
jgi:hypothetical protein